LENNLILGLDIGTSGVRAALYDERGDMLSKTLVKNDRSLETTDDGGSEIDAMLALKQVVKTIDDVLRSPLVRRAEIEYVASCAFWHSLVGVDSKGNPTTPVFGWADTRGRRYSHVLRKRFDETEIHDRTGARFHSSFWPAKLLWLRNERPEAFERTDLWLSFSDFVALKLFGIAATSVSMASATGVFDIRVCAWDARLVRFLGIGPSSLPLVSAGQYTFRLLEKFRKRWPRLKSAEWFPAIGDGAANNIGAGCLKRSKAALMVGTSGAMRVAYAGKAPEPIPSGLWCYRIDRNRVIVGGALSDGGNLYASLKEQLRIEISDDDVATEIARRGADAHGLTVMPFFYGERSTGYHENAGGAIIGMRPSHDAIDILQAALEAVAFRFAEILDQLRDVAPVRTIVASGGAIQASRVWTQIIADVLGKDLNVLHDDEASMRGAVLLALESIGKIDDVQSVSTDTLSLNYHPKCHAIYRAARKRHSSYYVRHFG
jgi:gluconokinase